MSPSYDTVFLYVPDTLRFLNHRSVSLPVQYLPKDLLHYRVESTSPTHLQSRVPVFDHHV